MKEDDVLAALAVIHVPELDARFAARVQARARAELAPSPDARSPDAPSADALSGARRRATLHGALVPALLTIAVIGRTAQTASVAATIFADHPHADAKDR